MLNSTPSHQSLKRQLQRYIRRCDRRSRRYIWLRGLQAREGGSAAASKTWFMVQSAASVVASKALSQSHLPAEQARHPPSVLKVKGTPCPPHHWLHKASPVRNLVFSLMPVPRDDRQLGPEGVERPRRWRSVVGGVEVKTSPRQRRHSWQR